MVRSILRVLATSALLVAVFLVAACVAGSEPVDTGAGADLDGTLDINSTGSDRTSASADGAPSVGEIVYRFDWDLSGVDVADDGIGVALTNDLGYRIEVDLGYLVTFSTELVECPSADAQEEDTAQDELEEEDHEDFPDAARWLGHIFGMGVAHAGHSSLDPNPAKLTVRLVEHLHVPASSEVGRVTAEGDRYCQIHYLAGKTMKDRANPAADVDMIGRSLYLVGRVQAPGAESFTELLVDADFANGVLLDLPESGGTVEAGVIDTAVEGATVTLVRSMATLFDGVDFDGMSDAEVANQIMKALVAGVSVEVQAD